MKRITTLFILVICLSLPISATTSTWIGTGFISHTAYLDDSEKINFNTYLNDTSEIYQIFFIGPSIDLNFIPYTSIPIGLKISTEFLFPTGLNDDSTFRTFHADYKNRNLFSISYNQMFSQIWGLFAEMGYEWDTYRIATTNEQNSKGPISYNRFSNHSLYFELGFLTTINNGYFKFGMDYSHSIINKASSFDVIFAGGYCF